MNLDFCYEVLAPLYLICALLMLGWSGYGEAGNLAAFWSRVGGLLLTPVFLVICLAMFGIIYASTKIVSQRLRIKVALAHSAVQLILVLFGTAAISLLSSRLVSIYLFGDILYFVALVAGMIVLGFVGAFVWGLYYVIASWCWHEDANNAFSAMRLDTYKNFVRFKVENDRLTIYPIGLRRPPKRDDWEINVSYETGNQDSPVIVTKNALDPHFIEKPIEIDMDAIKPLVLVTAN